MTFVNVEEGIVSQHQSWKIYTQAGLKKVFLFHKVGLLMPDTNLKFITLYIRSFLLDKLLRYIQVHSFQFYSNRLENRTFSKLISI